MEDWKPIPGFEHYDVNSVGDVRSRQGRNPRLLARRLDRRGYVRYSLCSHGKVQDRFAHQLVLEAFLGPRPQGQGTRHLDGNPGNNRLDNLEYADHAVNMADQYAHGTRARAASHGMAKLTCDQVDTIRRSAAPARVLACMLGCSTHMIWAVRAGRAWASYKTEP